MKLSFLESCDFAAGVPDSQLKSLCDFLARTRGISTRHVIAANEGNAAALAAGHYLATGKPAVVYLQNSGIGNIANPVASLLDERVFGIPCIFVIGWRGEPGVHDEPQHVFQGEITLKLLDALDIPYFIVQKSTTEDDVRRQMDEVFAPLLAQGKCVSFVVKKGALDFGVALEYKNGHSMPREKIIERIAQAAGEDAIVCTTGKASRELWELREKAGQGHERDFLVVGSMGHASSIALGVALGAPGRRVWCIDGDGAALMHLGAMAVIGVASPKNMIHVVINNEAHESVGGMPTVAGKIDLAKIAEGCGYSLCRSARTCDELSTALEEAKTCGALAFIEAKAAIGARADLGRPAETPAENKAAFMGYIRD